jgi:lipid-binding SYLF domain-containing protein
MNKQKLNSGVLALLFLVLTAMSTVQAASKEEIDIEVNAALERFRKEVTGSDQFLAKAKGVLVFPEVIKAGIGVGGEYGEGALRINGKTVDYYNTAAASIGLQLGAQMKTVILVFLQADALEKFRNTEGWEVGVDGSVALVEFGAGKDINSVSITDPVVGFVFSNKGLMYNLTLEGSKISKLKK